MLIVNVMTPVCVFITGLHCLSHGGEDSGSGESRNEINTFPLLVQHTVALAVHVCMNVCGSACLCHEGCVCVNR